MKFNIKTLGCKVNQSETEQVIQQLISYGHIQCENTHEAGLILINTCTVTHIADRKSRQFINRAYRENPSAQIVITGCMPQNEASPVPDIPGVTIVYKKNLSSWLRQFRKRKLSKPIEIQPGRTRKFIKIQNGCTNYCSYCIVPYVRPERYSLPSSQIVEQIRSEIDKGIREFILTGINTGQYQDGEVNLLGLLRKVLALQDHFRVRLSSLEPNFISPDLLKLIDDEEKLCPHLHIPLQGMTNSLLKAMNRKYSIEEYMNIIENVQRTQRQVTVTTDIIIGFPGETDADFRKGLELLSSGIFLNAHIFPFSPRKGTPAYVMDNQVDSSLKKNRLSQTIEIVEENKKKVLHRFLGKTTTVLLESLNKNLGYGFSEYYIPHKIQKCRKHNINQFVDVIGDNISIHKKQSVLIAHTK